MAEFNPTRSQKNAMEARGSTILVSAGAGSGKTRVLTERLMGYMTDKNHPVDLDSFVVITFTKAAAAELKSRISDGITEALEADSTNSRLRRQSALVDRAQIGTIHSFCAALLRENCQYLSLSPDFKIVDDDRAEAMKKAALDRTLDAFYTAAEPDFLLLADTVGAGRDDSRLSALISDLHEKMQCHARPEKWAREQVELLTRKVSDIAETPWGQEVLSRARSSTAYWYGELLRMMQDAAADEKLAKAYTPSLEHTAESLAALDRCLDRSWDKARECLPIPFDRLGGYKGDNPSLKEQIQARRDKCKEAMKKLAAWLSSPSEALLEDMRLTAPAMTALLKVTLAFDREYSADKLRNSLLDYADLEHMAARLLTDEEDRPSELARQLSRRYTEIMVDEYQDVSLVQDAIFRAISDNGKNLFLVGDVKQSIYRFRLADPKIFTEKYENYADYKGAPADTPRRIMLKENFRSRREILDAANRVFSLCMSRSLGDIDYDTNAALVCGADYYPGAGRKPRLLLLGTAGGDDSESPDKVEAEARMVGHEILHLVSSGAPVTDKGVSRPVEFSDIALLMRSANSVGGVYARVLSEMGIPVSRGPGASFFASVEVSAVTSALAVIDNPHQDIPLIALLRSPAFGFTADELSGIRMANRDSDFYTALCDRAAEDEKSRRFLEKLSALRAVSPDMTATQLTWHLLTELDLLSVCTAMSDGESRRANLMELLELAERFEGTGYRGLHRYVLWLRRFEESGKEPGLTGSEDTAVKIMTVHHSKGLEFPVVFLCDTARRFNKSDTTDTVLVHPQLGLGPKVTDVQRHVEYPTLARLAIRMRSEQELLSEEMRLLYVALTRPKEYLYITAAVKNPAKLLGEHSALVTVPMDPEVLYSSQSPLSWLLYAAIADGGDTLEYEIRSCENGGAPREDAPASVTADPALTEELARRVEFVYPYPDAVSLPSKVTATELKGYEEADGDGESLLTLSHKPFALPDFARADRPLTGRERGSATHLVLQFMDFSKTGSVEEIEGEIQRLYDRRYMGEREKNAVDARAIRRLFASELGERILRADKVLREFKFSLLCDSEELFHRAGGEKVLLQGVVDCCIEENGTLTVIDYKTDSVRTPKELQERAEHYAPQLRAYAAALRRMLGKEVKSCVLYFINASQAVDVEI